MKKIISLILALCMILMFVACTANENKTPDGTTPDGTTPDGTTPDSTKPENITPEITLQEVYDAGKNLTALLGNHENVYIQVTSNGKVVREQYLSKQYYYSFYDAEYMDMGFAYASFATERAEYSCFENNYWLNVTLTPNGMIDMKERFAIAGTVDFISSEVAEDNAATITEQDGFIVVTCNADLDEILIMGEDVVSCVETYTLDAKTHEMISVKTVYTYKNGTVEEGVATITRDVEAPEGVKEFIKFENETEKLHTVTVVSNPGTEKEKTERIQVPEGMLIDFTPDFGLDKTFTVYADAACTQVVEWGQAVDSDITFYIKWVE